MKKLIFVVEGNCESKFVSNQIIPYFNKLGFHNHIHPQKITTSREKNKKGGNVSYELFKNEIKNTLAQKDVIVTTLIDFFRLPNEFPNYSKDVSKIDKIEKGISKDFNNNPNLIPYIQQYEFEALLFCSITGYEFVIDEQEKIKKIQAIIDKYDNPEDINNSPVTSPSNRLKKIFNYDKVNDSQTIFNNTDMEIILEKCPRFAKWINTIIEKLLISNQD